MCQLTVKMSSGSVEDSDTSDSSNEFNYIKESTNFTLPKGGVSKVWKYLSRKEVVY